MHGLLHDEQGNMSSARALLWVTTVFILGTVVAALRGAVVPEPAWAVLASMESLFAVWAAGPRMAQYLVPVAKAAVKSVGDAIRARRNPEEGYEITP